MKECKRGCDRRREEHVLRGFTRLRHFWKQVNDVSKPKEVEAGITEKDGPQFTDEQEVVKSWNEYVEEMLNVMEDRKYNV